MDGNVPKRARTLSQPAKLRVKDVINIENITSKLDMATLKMLRVWLTDEIRSVHRACKTKLEVDFVNSCLRHLDQVKPEHLADISRMPLDALNKVRPGNWNLQKPEFKA
ncbi:hypothetical protein Cantr_05562 [Candida viswanathii]|uniref:Uncharacterized protein n=1 Tax=Candida viswanathii TaxID=5486 RepID=A0A367XQ05_9ASCO|nr:hypothetical protein Cantr_05562 [Candida viswanathii]